MSFWPVACALAAIIAFPTTSLAWGDEGHEIICTIARDLLDAGNRAEVDRLTRLYRRPDGVHYSEFASGCTFADFARGKASGRGRRGARGWAYFERFKKWHYLNVPRTTRTIEMTHCAGNCVLEAIDFHSRRCADARLDEWKRAEAMLLLAHWVGDAHQPLHVSYGDDRGGNDIRLFRGSYYSSADLHGVWDTGIIRKAVGRDGVDPYARRLGAAIPADARARWAASEPLAWAQESYEIATADAVDYCEWTGKSRSDRCRPEGPARRLDASYQRSVERSMEIQLQKAAVRLADRIRRCLGEAR